MSLRETNRRREVNRKRARSLREDVMLKMLDSTASQASAEPVRIRNDYLRRTQQFGMLALKDPTRLRPLAVGPTRRRVTRSPGDIRSRSPM